MSLKYLELTEATRNETETFIAEMNEKLLMRDDLVFYPYYKLYYEEVIISEINDQIVDLAEKVEMILEQFQIKMMQA